MRLPQRTTATRSTALLAVACVGLAATARAADEDARALAAGCASCHRASERIPPALAGQSREALVEKLRAFRDGTRDGTVMPQLARGYTPKQLDAVAAWFAAQPPPRR
jgi:cytochrome subunit of sulfide dehydrogenase